MEKVENYKKDKDGNVTICFEDTEANSDWLASSRLAESGSASDLKELKRKENESIYKEVKGEENNL